ncbi:MAG: ABC transporter permease [Spirochaetaceae bacterium]|nr:ABC transporter permease [Spirochaetaceae bacterium]
MGRFLARRFATMVLLVLGISVVSFVIIELPRGDFVSYHVLTLKAAGFEMAPEQVSNLRAQFGMDKPWYHRYVRWIGGIVLRGDFGWSFINNQPVSELIWGRVGLTALIAALSVTFTLVIGVVIGIYSAVHHYSVSDYLFTALGFLGLSIPNFLLALVLMWLGWSWFGITMGGLFSREFLYAAWSWARLWDLLTHLWVPVVVLGTAGTAGTMRVMRATTLDELGKQYVVTARAKGAPGMRVITRHVFKVAINPILSTIGWLLPAIFSGEAIVAIVLNLPTVGPLLFIALTTQDMFLAASLVFILSVLTVVGTLLSDIILAAVDHRIRYD